MFFMLAIPLAGIPQEKDQSSLNEENTTFLNTMLEAENQVEIYPNPATTNLFIEIKNSTLEQVEFEMHSIIGNKVEVDPEEVSDSKYRIPINELSTGYYFVVIKDSPTRFNKAFKFLKR